MSSMLSPGGYVRHSEKRSEKAARAVNVQVAVRCRPLNERERSAGERTIIQCEPSRREVHFSPPIGRKAPAGSNAGKKTFTYDHVFGPDASQGDVYQGVVKPIVDEVLEGYNCTVFAYGQTGTGKTHTMEGRRDESTVDISEKRLPKNAGMIPRAVKQVFDHLRSITDEHSVRVSHLELYNEQLTDLLGPEAETAELRMYEDSTKGVFVNGLEDVVVRSEEEIFEILDKSALKRRTAETLMNKFSSRSHSVFSITIHIKESCPDGTDLLKVGKLNLVDLAGSENVGRSGAVRGRAREAGNINQSLLTLGRVITALVEKHPHIPYRDSKLTRLLQESLGGRNKTCVIATATPASGSYEETASTLDYAYRAKSIKNRPTVNQMIAKHVLLKDYTDEITKLKRELDHSRSKHGVYLPPDEYERLTAAKQSQGELIEELQERVAEKERLYSDCKENLSRSRSESARLKRELEKKTDSLAATERKLDESEQKLDDEKAVASSYRNQASDYLAKGREMQSTLQNVISDNEALHVRVQEHKRIEVDNCRRINNLRDVVAKNERQYCTMLLEYESKHETHLENVHSTVADFVSHTQSRLDQISKNLRAFRDHSEALDKKHSENSLRFEDEVVNNVSAFEQTCNSNVQSQIARFSNIRNTVASESENITSVIAKLGQDVANLGAVFKSFEGEQATAFKEFVKAQKIGLDSASAQVSKLVSEHEERLSNVNSSMIACQDVLSKELEKMKSDVLASVAEVLTDSINKHAMLTKTNVDSTSSVITRAVEQARIENAKTVQICEDLSNSTVSFESAMRNKRTALANSMSSTVSAVTENTSQGVRMVNGQAHRVAQDLADAKTEVLSMQSVIADHSSDTTDRMQSRSVARVEEESARQEMVKEAEEHTKTRLQAVGAKVAEHNNDLENRIEQSRSIAVETRSEARDALASTIVHPITEFEIERDTKIGDAPERRKYSFPHKLDELLDRNLVIEEHHSRNNAFVTPVKESENKEEEDSVFRDDSEKMSEDVASESDDAQTIISEGVPSESDDARTTVSEGAPSRPPTFLVERKNLMIAPENTQHINTSRKRRGVARSKSSGIRRPKKLAASKSKRNGK